MQHSATFCTPFTTCFSCETLTAGSWHADLALLVSMRDELLPVGVKACLTYKMDFLHMLYGHMYVYQKTWPLCIDHVS